MDPEVAHAVNAMNDAVKHPKIRKIKDALAKLKALTKKHAAVLIVILVTIAAIIFGIHMKRAHAIAAKIIETTGVPHENDASTFVKETSHGLFKHSSIVTHVVENTVTAAEAQEAAKAIARNVKAARNHARGLQFAAEAGQTARAAHAARLAHLKAVSTIPKKVDIKAFAREVAKPGVLASTFGSFWKLVAGSMAAAVVLTSLQPSEDPEKYEDHVTAWIARRQRRAALAALATPTPTAPAETMTTTETTIDPGEGPSGLTWQERRNAYRAQQTVSAKKHDKAFRHPNTNFLARDNKPKAEVHTYDARRRAETSKLWNAEWNLENQRQKKRNNIHIQRELQKRHNRPMVPIVPNPNTPQYQAFINTATVNYYKRHPELIPKTTVNHLLDPNSPESQHHFELLRKAHALPPAAPNKVPAAMNRINHGFPGVHGPHIRSRL